MKRWQFWVGVLISIAFLWLVLRGLSIAEFLAVLPGIKFWWLIPGVVVYFIGVWVRTWRWHYLLRPIKSVPIPKLFPVVCIGYAGNNILPARAGELLRAVVLKRNEEIPVSSSLATIIVERVFDGVVMLSFVFLNLRELTGHTGSSGFVGNIQTLALVGTVAFIGALTLFLLAAMFPDKAQTAAELLSRWFIPARFRDKVLGFTERFLGGLAALRSPRDVLMVFVTSVIVWLLETAKYWFVMHAFPFEVSFFALMLMNGIVNLATTIPSAPGYVGTFDAPGIAVLQSYGVEQAVAVAYTLVLHAALWFPITALGLYYMAREGISWGQDMDQLRAEA
jgi:uncharacterized protein (TIRG00374 family)